MTALQENFSKNRGTPEDKWTRREQLILCSAVATCGSENWLAVSKNVKMVCGLNGGLNGGRPNDWFSQKCCALQYEYILENLEDTNASTTANESSTEMVLRCLKDERIDELKTEIRREQKEYAKIYTDLKAMQAHKLSEEQLLEMLQEIEKEQETQRIEEMKLENQMREREQRKIEMQRSWRAGAVAVAIQKPNSTDTTSVDMDVEEIIGTGKPIFSSILNISPPNNIQQQQPQQQSGISPLLTSLLKSPTAVSGTMSLTTSITSTTTSTNSARANAPTITTLLTSGSIPNPNQPAITLKNVPPSKSIQVLSRPISGPPAEATSTSLPTQNLISPSQSAPTLSMLLEKNKIQNEVNQGTSAASAIEEVKQAESNISKETVITAPDSNNEEVPMDIEEDIQMSIEKDSKSDNHVEDSDEPDPNEEQQLLEVFKNVAAVIDDEEVDFLKGVDEEIDTPEELDFEPKIEVDITTEIQNTENEEAKNQIESVQLTDTDSNKESAVEKIAPNIEEQTEETSKKDENSTDVKKQVTSDDDSNDNIPLADVISQENKENITEITKELNTTKENDDSAEKQMDETENSTKSDDNEVVTVIDQNSSDSSKVKEEDKPVVTEDKAVEDVKTKTDIDDANKKDNTENKITEVEEKEKPVDELIKKEPTEVKINVLETETNVSTKKSETNEEANATQSTEQTKNDTETNIKPTHTTSIADTDDDSCTTDVSSSNQKEDKFFTTTKLTAPSQRRTIHDTGIRGDNKTDDESSVTTAMPPVKPPTLRKLRDRDRSESPMIDDETTTTSDHSTTQRSRRRYSSTPVIDSIPNSPASSDRDEHRETRSSKKSLMSIYNALLHNKNATVFQRSYFDSHKPAYDEVCRRPIDFSIIKKNIDTGNIRTVIELQRDILLMCQNALMVFRTNSENYKTAYKFMQECQLIREFITNPHIKERQTEKDAKDVREGKTNTNIKVRASSRKSQRFS